MSTAKKCPACGSEVFADAVDGLCLKCLGRLGFFSESGVLDQGVLLRLGDYDLLEEIARGGMGVVYRARQLSLNRIVALKVLLHGPFSSADFVRRFRNEAQVVAALRHPNIVAVYEVGEQGGNHFLSLEFVEGRSFAELAGERPLPARRAAGYLKIIAEAVEHAHQRGVLHRDLKPSNILLDVFDQPRVTDFGLAKLVNSDAELTVTGQVLGSPNYMPPEQAAGKFSDSTPQSDVYSLGAILYELLANPTQLLPSLETKVCKNLFLAGQINGTSGYEEAGAQGIVAGINAVRRVKALDPIIIRRDQAYIGVLIDDLITKGTTEPYRMFTSRAEYRLLLRQDNADLRLSEIGHEVGLLPERNYNKFRSKQEAIKNEVYRLKSTYYVSDYLAKILSRPEVGYKDLPNRNDALSEAVIQQVEIAIKYAGYIKRQEMEIEKFKNLENKQIPDSFEFSSVPSLCLEARQKLSKIRPTTIGQAARISGVSPADISLLMVWLKRCGGASGGNDSSADAEACEAWETELEE